MATTVANTVVSEAEKVTSWRLETLIRVGYPQEIAEELAKSECDLHRAQGLIENGCPPKIAVAILL